MQALRRSSASAVVMVDFIIYSLTYVWLFESVPQISNVYTSGLPYFVEWSVSGDEGVDVAATAFGRAYTPARAVSRARGGLSSSSML